MIDLKNVCFHRKDGTSKRLVIDNLSHTLSAGEQVALLGDSGSGKTTLLNLLAGLLRPDSGQIIINNEQISQYNKEQLALYRRKIGIVFQHYQLLSPLNVKDNMCFQAELNGIELHTQQVHDLAASLGLESKLNAYPAELSGGEQQRVGIGRALINSPKLILADEPTGNLDAKRSIEVVSLLKEQCAARNIILVMVTHSHKLAEQFSTRLYLKDGKLNV